ncbi:ribosomal protein L11 methyltransferase [Lentisphaera araneosa HTCC2155]|uniref:Ribosomal protein L11 methyltransferase n=1 Tax=Lentisphaera araneosa HTCC2155 TaxID=313628 RepID=A6DQ06_9BACT|nr:50S ribosomal protein L11 methyltransferase [Lentisphaera araneosa]EDM26247.1 ribosomal protein L11 methyltransferase [Lentisphaera araneosa HTCC2155]
MTKPQEILYVVSLLTNSAVGEMLDEMLPIEELYPTSYFDKDDDIARMSLYYETEEERDEVQGRIEAALENWSSFIDTDEVDVIAQEVLREDWSETWKKFFHTVKVSDRIVIKPSWEDYEIQEADEVVLEIDPGMSFGTGNHGTTKACLQFIDEASALESGMSFLDAGCGSGILSLAADRLGCSPVEAFDYDPEAVDCTKRHFDDIDALDRIDVFQADLTTLDLGKQYDIIAANILAPVLLGASDKLMNHLKKGENSRLILAGILTEQYPEIKTHFELLGLKELRSAQIDEWTSGVFKF